jgi:hypothetical protein
VRAVEADAAGSSWPAADEPCDRCGEPVTGPFVANGRELVCVECIHRDFSHVWVECQSCARSFATARPPAARTPRPSDDARDGPRPTAGGSASGAASTTSRGRADGRYCSGAHRQAA